MSRRRPPELVRYVPLFGSPFWTTLDDAELRLRRDDDVYLRLADAGARPSHAPQIERRSPPAARAGRRR